MSTTALNRSDKKKDIVLPNFSALSALTAHRLFFTLKMSFSVSAWAHVRPCVGFAVTVLLWHSRSRLRVSSPGDTG